MGGRGHNRHGRKEGAAVPLSRTAGTTSNTMWPSCAEVYFRTKWRVHPSSHLATLDMGQKLVGVGVPFSGSSWVPIKHKVAWAEAYLHSKQHLSQFSRLTTMDNGRKLGDCAPLEEGRNHEIVMLKNCVNKRKQQFQPLKIVVETILV